MVLLSRNLISRSRKVSLLVLTWKWSLVNSTPEILEQCMLQEFFIEISMVNPPLTPSKNKRSVAYITHFRNNLPLEKGMALNFNNFKFPSLKKMLCAKFGWNCSSGYGEDENMQCLQMDGHHEIRYRRSSFELSAKASL